jgi:hypothetical protein
MTSNRLLHPSVCLISARHVDKLRTDLIVCSGRSASIVGHFSQGLLDLEKWDVMTICLSDRGE